MNMETETGPATGMSSMHIKVSTTPLAEQAIAVARGTDVDKHRQLRDQLQDQAYLMQLNTADDYLRVPPHQLQLHFILEALAGNAADQAVQTLDALAASPQYQESGVFREMLLQASGLMKSAPDNIKSLWQAQLGPEAEELDLTIAMLVENGSPEAIGLLEQTLLKNKYEHDYVIAWMQDAFLRHRQDLYLLEACERLLASAQWPLDLKNALVEVLFDYRPSYWYPMQEAPPPKPPARESLDKLARIRLLSIAELAMNKGYMDKARYHEVRTELGQK